MDETTTQTRTSSFQVSQSLSSRYEGYIDVPIIDQIQNSLMRLFSYLDNYAPRVTFIYSFITFIRFLQIIGPSLVIFNHKVWDSDAISTKFLDICAFLFDIVPVFARVNQEVIILLGFSVILLVILFFIIFTAFRYVKTARVPKLSNYTVTIFIAGFGFTFPCVTIEYLGEVISSLIGGNEKVSVLAIISIVLGVIEIAAYSYVLMDCYNFTLTFRSCSFITTEGGAQNYLIGCTLALTFLLALTKYLPSIAQAVIMVISIIPYAILIYKLFDGASFVHELHQVLILAGCITSIIYIIGNIIAIFWRPYNEIEFLIYWPSHFSYLYEKCHFFIHTPCFLGNTFF